MDASVREELICVREPFNSVDRYTVSVKKDDTIVRHLPKKISRICLLFLHRGGNIECVVSGRRSKLEIPCSPLFHGKEKETKKLKQFCKTNTVTKEH